MNHYSDVSKTRLFTCHRDLQTIFNHVIIEFDCTIVCGHRDKAGQDKAFAEGKSKLPYPQSKHNHIPSLAVDAAPFIDGKVDWTRDQLLFFAGYVKGIADQLYRIGVVKHRIRLGADFSGDNDVNDERFRDEPHFELILNDTDK
jgi:peptidoglycan L-alanyl-D-glutamate endopeptidase CwlK